MKTTAIPTRISLIPASGLCPKVYAIGVQRNVSLEDGYYQITPNRWFLQNPNSKEGVLVSVKGEHMGYFSSVEDVVNRESVHVTF